MARLAPSVALEQLPDQPLRIRLLLLVMVTLPFLVTCSVLFLLWGRWVGWLDVSLMLGFYLVAGLGKSLGYHRLLAHKSFATTPWLKRLLLMLGCLAFEGDPLRWSVKHIQCHAYADVEAAPPRPLAGFWQAHLTWLVEPQPSAAVYATWLKKDPVAVGVSQTWLVWASLGLLIPLVVAGWSGLFWAGLVRIALSHHITWSAHALCHAFGQRDFPTRDGSRNHFMVALFCFGEGWLNNHHAFPRAASFSLAWWQIDSAGAMIHWFERLGLVWNVMRGGERRSGGEAERWRNGEA
ncbi:MAG: acyl-CoA desaturase [Candidatus Viridilinea halotolerans]|uniref:Acyl-CoA desaturase n=1 Tax=Candidatus Viridilinea halotolerans TaxID=2491704 RepID=A0A426UBT5_9CHLR|nr:MAG: acyl-CoA desaturase [Candidatus Viridilinea halotolerans]